MRKNKESKGHILFTEKYEYFKIDNGDVYQVDRMSYITEDGRRTGARFYCTSSCWDCWKDSGHLE